MGQMPRAQSICFCDSQERRGEGVATFKVLYWQEIPSQIRAEDDEDEVSVMLPPRFQVRIDTLATARGLQAAEDYLAQWKWSHEQQRNGSAQHVADAVKAELEAKADW